MTMQTIETIEVPFQKKSTLQKMLPDAWNATIWVTGPDSKSDIPREPWNEKLWKNKQIKVH